MHQNTYTYSQLSSHSAGQLVVSQYDLNAPLICKYYVLGLHDNYLVESDNRKYILRIYRNNWRSNQEIHFELELLAFLNSQTDQVAQLVPAKNGDLAFAIDSPEGERMAALFCYADGTAPGNSITADQAQLLGRTIANIHILSETFTTAHTRTALDIPYLLDESILALRQFVDSKGYNDLVQMQDKFRNVLPGLEKDAGVFGICIGDVNSSNFHINQNNHITVFDFDQCGYGYRAFEIGKFFSSIHSHKDKLSIEAAFLNGYQKIRPLSKAEKKVIPYFKMVSVIWVMAIHAVNADRIGHKYLEKPFWDKRLSILEELGAELF
jgi:Ser/Thr protein kinase RdoA (MazF antagonist)